MTANRGGSTRTRDIRMMFAGRGRRDFLHDKQVSRTQNRLAHFANSDKEPDEDPAEAKRAAKAKAAAACVPGCWGSLLLSTGARAADACVPGC